MARQGQARWSLTGEEIVPVSEVLQLSKPTDGVGDGAGEHIVGDVELFQALHLPDLAGQRAQQLVVADVEHRHVLEQSDGGRQARLQSAIDENDLIEGGGHLAQARRKATPEVVVGEHDDRHRGVADVVRELVHQAIVVDEDGVELLLEKLPGDGPLELVESEVEVLEGRQAEDNLWEFSGEAVVAEIQFVEELHLVELAGHGAAEAVGVDVEQCKIL